MKFVLLIAFAVASAAASALSLDPAQPAEQSEASSGSKPEAGFYCDRLALNPEQRKRKEELNDTLRSLQKVTRELQNGYEFEFPPSALQSAAEWIALERLCCPFFDFELRLQANGGPLSLRLSGSSGVKQFIRAEFPDWFKE